MSPTKVESKLGAGEVRVGQVAVVVQVRSFAARTQAAFGATHALTEQLVVRQIHVIVAVQIPGEGRAW